MKWDAIKKLFVFMNRELSQNILISGWDQEDSCVCEVFQCGRAFEAFCYVIFMDIEWKHPIQCYNCAE